MTLFIIGNGFDLSTGYKTKYEHFKEYLSKNRSKYCLSGFPLLDILPSDNYEFWKDFEENLATMPLTTLTFGYECKEKQSRKNKYIIDNLNAVLEKLYKIIGNAFSDFIEDATKELKPMNKLFISRFASCDRFITFNYSLTLESVYGINDKNICYIHGVFLPFRKENEDNNNIIFGHSGDVLDNSNVQTLYYDNNEPEYLKKKIRESLTKQLEIYEFERFIGKLNNYDEIQIIGHSLGNVDKRYFEKLNTAITPRIIYWQYVDSETFDEEKTKKKVKGLFPKVKCSIHFYNDSSLLKTIDVFS